LAPKHAPAEEAHEEVAHTPEAPPGSHGSSHGEPDGGPSDGGEHEELAHLPAPSGVPVPLTEEDFIAQLMAGNSRFVEGTTRQRDAVARRESLSGEERAEAVVVTCTDSRVIPELLFDQPLGTFSVVRMPGAQIDASSASAVDDAIKRLHPKLVLLLGHTGCHHVLQSLKGASASSRGRPNSLASALAGLSGSLQGEALELAAAQQSVSFAMSELRRRSRVKGTSASHLRLLYSPQSGLVRWLDAEAATKPEPEPAPHASVR
jgi:carbonic anhydrase